jgi:hypothetical protein
VSPIAAPAENGEMAFRPGSERQAHELDFLAHTFLTVSKVPIFAGCVGKRKLVCSSTTHETCAF